MRLAQPAWLFLLVLAPLPLLAGRLRRRLGWPTLSALTVTPPGLLARLGWLPAALLSLALASLAIALARPQTVVGRTRVAGQGVAILLVLDHSSSMKTPDFPDASGARISRLEAARATAERFIAGRPDDLLGLVVFANYPDLACPPTLDHAFLIDAVRAIRPARPGDDGTNLGDALAWALEAIRTAPTRRKVVVLLTDGDNEPAVPNPVDPLAAADLARDLGVTLHTIAIGAEGGVARPREEVTGLEVPIDVPGPNPALLRAMAERGGGRMFQATDAASLDEVFRAIDELEKSPVSGTIRTRYRDWSPVALALALVFCVLSLLLSSGRWRRLP